MPEPITSGLLTWDHRDQPDLDELAGLLRDLTGGKVRLGIAVTGDDQYAILLSVEGADLFSASVAYDRFQETGETRWAS